MKDVLEANPFLRMQPQEQIQQYRVSMSFLKVTHTTYGESDVPQTEEPQQAEALMRDGDCPGNGGQVERPLLARRGPRGFA